MMSTLGTNLCREGPLPLTLPRFSLVHKYLPSAPIERCSSLIFTDINLLETQVARGRVGSSRSLRIFLASPDFNGIIPHVLMSSCLARNGTERVPSSAPDKIS